MVLYFTALCAALGEDEARGRQALRQAQGAAPDYFFPNQLECVPALETALCLEPRDWKAAYGLGKKVAALLRQNSDANFVREQVRKEFAGTATLRAA